MRSQIMDLTGHVYTRLKVLEYAGKTKAVLWKCLCECGREKIVQANNLRSGHTKSCGCLQEELKGKHSITHGKTGSRAYNTWASMRQRCKNPHKEGYKWYGGKGIKVCEEWESFENFYRDMGDPPDKFELDRIDGNKEYSKENCKWVSHEENMSHASNAVLLQYKGKEMPIRRIASITGVEYNALRRRIRDWGMSVEEAVISAENRRIVKCRKN